MEEEQLRYQIRKEAIKEILEDMERRFPFITMFYDLPNKIASAIGISTPQNTPPSVELKYDYLDPIDKICYSALEEYSDYLAVDGMFVRVLFVAGYPDQAVSNWLGNLINFNGDIDISLHFEPIDQRKALDILKRKSTELVAQRSSASEKGFLVGVEIEHPLQSSEVLRDKIFRQEASLFDLSLYIAITAGSLEVLDETTQILRTRLGAQRFSVKPAYYQQIPGFDSVLPKLDNQLGMRRNLDSASAATIFPFVSSELADENGILYGESKANNSLVIFDRFRLPNYNSIVVAPAGSGKSYAVKLETLRHLMQKTRVIVIDPEGEYRPLCEAVGGSHIILGVNSPQRINPFDPPKFEGEDMEDTFPGHIQTLAGLLSLMVGGEVTPGERASLEMALEKTYSAFGIRMNNKVAQILEKYSAPLLANIYHVLRSELREENLAKRLHRYVEGHLTGLFDKPTNVELNNRFVVFNIQKLENNEQMLPIIMFIIAHFVWHKIEEYPGDKKLLVIDEAWRLLKHPNSADFITGLIRRGRKRWLGVTVISQDIKDFSQGKYGEIVLSQSATKLLLKQDPSVIKEVTEVFHLSEEEKRFLIHCGTGEGILIADEDHVSLKIEASGEEHKLITTHPEERYKLDQIKIEEEKRKKEMEGETQ